MPFIGKQPETGAFKLIDSITTSATATYALTVNSAAYFPESARNLIVSLNGVTQAPESAYTVSGSNIVFASALTASDVIDYILVIGDAVDIGTPSDNTVGTDQIASSVDLSGKTLTFANDQISGNIIDGGTISNFASTGIDDNATSTAITIDASENVGIGTSSPLFLLHGYETPGNGAYSDTTNMAATARFHSAEATTGSYTAIQLAANNGNSALGWWNIGTVSTSTNYDNHLVFQTRTGSATYAERMRIDSSGALILNQSAGSSDNTILRLMGGTAGYSTLQFADSDDLNIGMLQYNHSTNALAFNVNDSERMRINSSGFVGIGTSSPDRYLHVNQSRSGDWLAEIHNTHATNGFGLKVRAADDANTTAFYVADVSNTALFAVNGDGNVGIGTTTPNEKLNVSGNIRVTSGFVSFSGSTSTPSEAAALYRPADNTLAFSTANAERMRIDSSGNLLVGTTTALTSAELSAGETGIALRSANLLIVSREAGAGVLVNRKTSNGDFIEFRKDGSTVGSIGSEGGDALYVGTGDTGLKFSAADIIQPFNPSTVAVRDGGIDLGNSGARFKDIYLSGGAYIGGTAAANKLDDYEEGTWTPVLNGSPTHSASNQYYVKIGNLVHVGAYIYSVSDYTSATDFTISGLPYTTNNARGVGSVMFRDINDSTIAQLNSYVSSNSSTVYFYASQNNGGNWDPLEYADGDGGLIDMIFNITYLIS